MTIRTWKHETQMSTNKTETGKTGKYGVQTGNL